MPRYGLRVGLSDGQLGSCALVPLPGWMALPSVRPALVHLGRQPAFTPAAAGLRYAPFAVAAHTAEKLCGTSEMVTCEGFPTQAITRRTGSRGRRRGRQPDPGVLPNTTASTGARNSVRSRRPVVGGGSIAAAHQRAAEFSACSSYLLSPRARLLSSRASSAAGSAAAECRVSGWPCRRPRADRPPPQCLE
jgi:hypothetical protein